MRKFIQFVLLCVLFLGQCIQVSADNTFGNTRTDFRDESIYFVITTRFYDGDTGNNVLCWDNQESQISTKDPCWRGDFQGLIDKLDYIKALGFSAIWITPIVQNASGYDYHGYHASDFTKVDCRYQGSDGTSADVEFQKLITEAHKKGIKIILDIVLNHTGNFGEETLCKEFTRKTSLSAQGNLDYCMIPNTDVLGSDYSTIPGAQQYGRRLALQKNTDGQNHDTHNYWHHYAEFNWDEPNRWWAQIAGDCVDLNTENPAVSNYLIKCYEQFMKMGVDGFRIDTSGHIARLTFNQAFIPQFTELGKKYASARLLAGQTEATPFYMYGEVCTRYSSIVYRDQPNLSTYFYTWKSDPTVAAQWNTDATWWDTQVVPSTSSDASVIGNMQLDLQDKLDQHNSTNHLLLNNQWHEPDYSQSSGFNVIDFPVHYNFTNASSAYGLATSGDQYYNDATWNVVYVDSHDYGPQPNDQNRFNGGTNQWAENLTWMFLFRGIPCIYYGSEVEFQAGKKIDNGPNGPLSDTGRAYFGQNLEGTVSASDFGLFTASGQVATTLSGPLCKHLAELNRIRQSSQALRKGQYSTDGCTKARGWAWKKAYKDEWAVVGQQSGATTVSGIPNGTYVEAVTGESKTVSNGTLSFNCPTQQGCARVWILNGKKIGGDSPFLQGQSASEISLASDPGTTWNEIQEAPEPTVTMSPNGGSFTSETQTVTLTLQNATSGWYKIGDGAQTTLSGSTTVTIGAGMQAGESVTISWGATGPDENGNTVTKTGSATFKKVGVYTPVVSADEKSVFYETDAESVSIWVWNGSANFTGGDWNKKPTMEFMGNSTNGRKIYKWTYTGDESTMPTHVIFVPQGSDQSADLEYKNHGYYIDNVWNHEVTALDNTPSVSLSPTSQTFTGSITVTATANNGATAVYTTDGSTPTASSASFTGSKTFTFTATTTLKVGVLAKGSVSGVKTGVYTLESEVAYPYCFFVNSGNWTTVSVWAWQLGQDGAVYVGKAWPGVTLSVKVGTYQGADIYKWTSTKTDEPNGGIIFSTDKGNTRAGGGDLVFENGAYYNADGKITDSSVLAELQKTTGIRTLRTSHAGRYVVYTLQGAKVAEVSSMESLEYTLQSGIYIVNGRKVIVR